MLARPIKFSKYQGTANDFVILDRQECPPVDHALARRLCDRRLGIGADGVLSIRRPGISGADLRMEIHNADGSRAQTCGNGLRCFAAHVLSALPGFAGKKELSIETDAGVVGAELLGTRGAESIVRVEMGRPGLDAAEVPVALPLPASGRIIDQEIDLGERRARLTAVSMGNPHAVIFVDEEPSAALEFLGPRLVDHRAFPEGVNVGAARLEGQSILLSVWERGVGPTGSCGSGACAAAVAARLTGRLSAGSVEVRLPGGVLVVELSDSLELVHLRGPATKVFEGSLDPCGFSESLRSDMDAGRVREEDEQEEGRQLSEKEDLAPRCCGAEDEDEGRGS